MQLECQISVKSVETNNNYSSFVRIHHNTSCSFKFLCLTSSTETWNGSAWGNLTKAAVTTVCVGRNFACWLWINDALLVSIFFRIKCCLSKLHKCTLEERFTYVAPYWRRRYLVSDIQQLITPLINNIFQPNLVISLPIYWGLSVRNVIFFFRFDISVVRCLAG